MRIGFCINAAKLLTIGFLSSSPAMEGVPNIRFVPKMGFEIECLYIVMVTRVTLRECYNQCSARETCLSFNYVVLYKHCIMCANDAINGNITRSPGVVYGQIDTSDKDRTTTDCNCKAHQFCDIQQGSRVCRTTECQQWPTAKTSLQMDGNMRTVGSHAIVRCPKGQITHSVSRVTCEADGQWSPPSNVSCSVPDYQGCFVDVPSRIFDFGPFTIDDMTNSKCMMYCRHVLESPNISYFGTQYGIQCCCSESYPVDSPVEDDECDKPCSGNTEEICGGTWRMSVYEVQPLNVYL